MIHIFIANTDVTPLKASYPEDKVKVIRNSALFLYPNNAVPCNHPISSRVLYSHTNNPKFRLTQLLTCRPWERPSGPGCRW